MTSPASGSGDMFHQLYDPLNPIDKLRTCATCNLVDQLAELIKGGIDVNHKVQEHTGNTAAHICCQKGHFKALDMLLKAGANADEPNDFGITPIAFALKNGHVQCVESLWKTGSLLSDPGIVWTSTQPNSSDPLWTNYSTDVLRSLLVATPSVFGYGEEVYTMLYNKFLKPAQSADLVKSYLMTGQHVTTEHLQAIQANADDELKSWMADFNRVHTLQHQVARVHIRRCLTPNCMYGAVKITGLPVKLREYLIYDQ